ncbi:MAG: type III polyketide synthase [Vicingaceae bacterium]
MEHNRKSKVISIGTAIPTFKYAQADLAGWMHQRLNNQDERLGRKLRILYEKTSIQYRHSVLPDFGAKNDSPQLFIASDREPAIEERLAVYKNEAVKLGLSAANNCLGKTSIQKHDITHLITVSCTGMSAPGLEIVLKKELQLSPKTQTHAVNFIGCYAAFPALKMADAFCKVDPSAKVLIVAVELCTLHFQNKITDDHLLSNSLFADGAAAALIGNGDNGGKLTIENFSNLLMAEGKNDMAWDIYADGFLMKLSSYIPQLVDKGIGVLLKATGVEKENIHHWAIHPGGRKILEACEKEFELRSDDLAASYSVLRNYGNLSAPTILFVLEELLTSKNPKAGESIFSCGFGPGLTLESAVFKVAEDA